MRSLKPLSREHNMFVLATDLDGTFIGGSLQDRNKLYQLIHSMKDQIILVFVTGRALENVAPILADPAIPKPNYIIANVGATILYGDTLKPVEPLDSELGKSWVGEDCILDVIPAGIALERQKQAQERRCSFYTGDINIVEIVRAAVAPLGCEVLYSANRYLDILPAGITKGAALCKLMTYLNIDAENVLVAGDTLNDLSMYTDTPFKGVVVGGGQAELREATRHRADTYQANKIGTGGILEALEVLGFSKRFDEQTTYGEAELVVVYHRQPFDEICENGILKQVMPQSPNGIIPTLLGLFRSGKKGAWIAWSKIEEQYFEKRVVMDNQNLTISRLLLTQDDVELFYQKFSKEALWPVLHGFIERAEFNHRHWQHFIHINKKFAESTASEAKKNALIWIHDYNLWLVPEYLRQLRPDLQIAFFHHTPFPSGDIFNVIPWSNEIIASLLQCDYIGFHIPRYCENFVDAARSYFPVTVRSRVDCDERFMTSGSGLCINRSATELTYDNRTVRLGAHPVGLDFNRINKNIESSEWRMAVKQLQKDMLGQTVIVSAERLDYTKGTLQKLLAYEKFLSIYPDWREKITLVNICTPPSSGMTIYDDIKIQLDQAVGRINGKFSTANWAPIISMYRYIPFEELSKYLAIADVAWITPLRDGLNLLAKEYVAIRNAISGNGALIISQFAGASVELQGAFLTNPYDVTEMAMTLEDTLTVNEEERKRRMARLGESIGKYDINHWVDDFIKSSIKN
jgi:glucosylglycerol-phosphate synthase